MTERCRPRGVISVRKAMPPTHEKVFGWIADRTVAIHDWPLIVWRDYSGEWWGGVPGNYIDLTRLKWKVTHWCSVASVLGEIRNNTQEGK
jgi:hypothetical protein